MNDYTQAAIAIGAICLVATFVVPIMLPAIQFYYQRWRAYRMPLNSSQYRILQVLFEMSQQTSLGFYFPYPDSSPRSSFSAMVLAQQVNLPFQEVVRILQQLHTNGYIGLSYDDGPDYSVGLVPYGRLALRQASERKEASLFKRILLLLEAMFYTYY